MTIAIMEHSPSDPVPSSFPLLFQQIVEVAPTPQVLEPINCPIVLLQCAYILLKRAMASDIKPANTTETVVEIQLLDCLELNYSIVWLL